MMTMTDAFVSTFCQPINIIIDGYFVLFFQHVGKLPKEGDNTMLFFVHPKLAPRITIHINEMLLFWHFGMGVLPPLMTSSAPKTCSKNHDHTKFNSMTMLLFWHFGMGTAFSASAPNHLISSQSLSDGTPRESHLPHKYNFKIVLHLHSKRENL